MKLISLNKKPSRKFEKAFLVAVGGGIEPP